VWIDSLLFHFHMFSKVSCLLFGVSAVRTAEWIFIKYNTVWFYSNFLWHIRFFVKIGQQQYMHHMKTYLHLCMHLECVTCSIFIQENMFQTIPVQKNEIHFMPNTLLYTIHFQGNYKKGKFYVILSCNSKTVGLILVVVDKWALQVAFKPQNLEWTCQNCYSNIVLTFPNLFLSASHFRIHF